MNTLLNSQIQMCPTVPVILKWKGQAGQLPTGFSGVLPNHCQEAMFVCFPVEVMNLAGLLFPAILFNSRFVCICSNLF